MITAAWDSIPRGGQRGWLLGCWAAPLCHQAIAKPTRSTSEQISSLSTFSAARPVWEAKEAHPSGVSALAAGRLPGGAPILASGGRDGTVKLWAPQRAQLLMALDTAQYSKGVCASLHHCS